MKNVFCRIVVVIGIFITISSVSAVPQWIEVPLDDIDHFDRRCDYRALIELTQRPVSPAAEGIVPQPETRSISFSKVSNDMITSCDDRKYDDDYDDENHENKIQINEGWIVYKNKSQYICSRPYGRGEENYEVIKLESYCPIMEYENKIEQQDVKIEDLGQQLNKALAELSRVGRAFQGLVYSMQATIQSHETQ